MTDSILLQAKELCWQVKDKVILDNMSFRVTAGEFVGVIGPNGSGKSSLLRCIYGKNKISSGQLELFSKPISQYDRRGLAQKVAVVLQEPPTRFELSVIDVIRMGLTPNKPLLSFDTPQDEQKIKVAANQVDLVDKLEQSFNSLSGGEKQRAMIARAILQSPELLLMDEPTNHLDVKHQIEVLELAKSLGKTVLVSIHDLNLAAAYCDRLILLDEGKILAKGQVEEVLTQTTLQEVFKVAAVVDKHPFNQKLRITFDVKPPEENASNLDGTFEQVITESVNLGKTSNG
ncbi:MAG: ABC transporter ATP-binding protein [Kangiellaceae bacterium]|nr:ABC transporter ATP-binding protein [Kangiellaceae bacterium]MCW8998644.1 ABC transporter ATP-binding protein [Kangiellaceae bacterium]MCW9016777.1 ABC transporter ATP-binding protein [Kangiellaceae bacterium]